MNDFTQQIAEAIAEIDANGFAIVPDALTPAQVEHTLERLWAASNESERRGNPTHIDGLDPNAENVRVFNLIDLDPVFAELIDHPTARALAAGVLGHDYIISNFTANIARPGSESMAVHSDQAIVAPEPWLSPWSINVSGASPTFTRQTEPPSTCPTATAGPPQATCRATSRPG
jgi:hypothetical protein